MQQQLAAQIRSVLQSQQMQQQGQGEAQPPHRSHADPWAHEFICCDKSHAASTSHPTSTQSLFGDVNGTSPITGNFPFANSLTFPNPALPPTSTSPMPNTMNQKSNKGSHGCDDDACCTEPTCGPVECCTDPSCAAEGCDDAHQHHQRAGGGANRGASTDEELIKWACSDEGCEAIQQFVSSGSSDLSSGDTGI